MRLVLLGFVLLAGEYLDQSTRTFEDARCGVAFEHPEDWAVQEDDTPTAIECVFLVRPHDYERQLILNDSFDLHTVYVTVTDHPFETAAQNAGFAARDGQWVVLGLPGVEEPAERIVSDDWTGVRGIGVGSCSRIGGGFSGVCSLPSGVVGTDRKSASVQARPQAEAVFDLILATIVLSEGELPGL